MAENELNTPKPGEPDASASSGSGKSSKFLAFGKYFLLLAAVVFQIGAAYTLVDENYERIYVSVFGGLPDFSAEYPMEDIVVNPARSNGQRFLVIGMSLELYHHDHIPLLERNLTNIKENLMRIAASRSVNELVAFEEREVMREEMINEINEITGVSSVRNLYFTRYIMQ
ncbi:MAG: flagellar basal body-associated protein FliL [Bacteroidetes bacterium HLUCCA01]|nr:MAG: flagellar basal body-associated protein FliL [Bacteroidetes bacterium HLUCCA01]